MNGWMIVAALNGLLAVAAGAFASHGLEGVLDAASLRRFDIGARYHMYHALAMGLAAIMAGAAGAPRAAKTARIAAALFFVGLVLFSGSLYLLALTGVSWLGAVTPVGGITFLAGWAALALAAMRWR